MFLSKFIAASCDIFFPRISAIPFSSFFGTLPDACGYTLPSSVKIRSEQPFFLISSIKSIPHKFIKFIFSQVPLLEPIPPSFSVFLKFRNGLLDIPYTGIFHLVHTENDVLEDVGQTITLDGDENIRAILAVKKMEIKSESNHINLPLFDCCLFLYHKSILLNTTCQGLITKNFVNFYFLPR